MAPPISTSTEDAGGSWQIIRTRTNANRGKIVEIKGVVIDAVFPNELPAIYSALRITVDDRELIAEVQQHLGDDRVRAVAMDSTDGPRARRREHRPADLRARRGRDARPALERDRRPDRQGRRAAGGYRALADPPGPAELPRALPDRRDLRDRDQGHRPDRPVRAGRQGRPLRRRRRRQDRPDPGVDPQRRAGARRRLRLRRRR